MSHDAHLDSQEHHQRHFMRSIRTPLEILSEMEDKVILKRLLDSISPEDQEILREHFAADTMEMLREDQHKMLGLIEKVVSFIAFPFAWPKVWAVVYALDLSPHEGRNMSATAARLGVTRAAISVHAREFLELIGLSIGTSRWLRSDETAQASKSAREKYTNQKTK